MKFRKAELQDLNEIIDVYNNAIITMEKNNIHQWDEIYPSFSILKEDILNRDMYVVTKKNIIVSAFVINKDFDDQYINGKWKYDNESFVVIHRLCVNPIYQNQKVGRSTMLIIEEQLKNDGIESIRLDAFSQNPYALRMYQNLGYEKVGEATWRKGLFYLLEKKL